MSSSPSSPSSVTSTDGIIIHMCSSTMRSSIRPSKRRLRIIQVLLWSLGPSTLRCGVSQIGSTPRLPRRVLRSKVMLQLCMVVWKVIMPCAGSTQGSCSLCNLAHEMLTRFRFFYKHELLAKYEWYWRLEPEIKYFCDIT